MDRIRFATIAVLAGFAAAASAPALAAASGGGASLPSTSGPRVDPAAAFQEGVAALKENDFKTAEKKFGDVLSVAPKHPEANYYMALAMIGAGKEKNAVKYLERAIKERANFVEAREKLAIVEINLGEPDVAREQLAAIEGLKSDCAASNDCDEAYVARVATAIDRINAALAGGATTAPAAEPASDEADDADEAEEKPEDQQFSLLFAPPSQGAGAYAASVRLINQGQYRAAIDELRAAEAIIGPHPDILNYLGFSHRKLGLMDDAQRYYRAALAIDPDHKGANEYLGELYIEIGDMKAAKRQLARLDAICAFTCAEREDLARLIDRREGAVAAN